jgi:Arc/MetJ-type ribon-helix-helix transcriptional regulator
MPTVTVKLPAGLESRLRAAVVRRRSTRSALVREALEAHLAGGSADAPEESCLGLASDLAGSLTGPADLSSNPRRMRGYGR